MKQLTKYFVFLGLFLSFQSCKKEEPSPFPEIEFISISATEVVVAEVSGSNYLIQRCERRFRNYRRR